VTQNVQLTTYVSPKLAERLAKLAAQDHRSVAYLIREALRLYLAAGEGKRGR